MSWNVYEHERKEYAADIKALRQTFLETVDVNDKDQYRSWFLTHKNLTTYDHSLILDVSYEKVMEIKKSLGLEVQKTGDAERATKQYVSVVDTEVPSDWRNDKEWLKAVIQQHSLNSLAKLCKVSRNALRTCFARHNLDYRNQLKKVKNPYDNEHWLHENYSIKLKPLSECAKAAGVGVHTVISWLRKYKIKVRNHKEANAVRYAFNHKVPIWVKNLANQLEKLPIVRRATCKTGYLQVSFVHDVKENWHYDALDASKSHLKLYINRVLKFRRYKVHEIYNRELSKVYNHHIIERKKFKRLHLATQRVAIHDFIHKMRNAPDFHLPDYAIKEDLKRIEEYSLDKCSNRGIILSTPPCHKRLPGWDSYVHFFGSNLFKQRRKARVYRRGFAYLLAQKRYDITTVDVIRFICAHDQIKVYSPVVYRHLLHLIGFKGGSILDVHPHYGQRALAIAGCRDVIYYTEPNETFDQSNMTSELGLPHKSYNGENVDLTIIDDNMRDTTVDVIEYMKRTKHLLLFCSADKLPYFEAYKPSMVYKVNVRFKRRCNYYLFW